MMVSEETMMVPVDVGVEEVVAMAARVAEGGGEDVHRTRVPRSRFCIATTEEPLTKTNRCQT